MVTISAITTAAVAIMCRSTVIKETERLWSLLKWEREVVHHGAYTNVYNCIFLLTPEAISQTVLFLVYLIEWCLE